MTPTFIQLTEVTLRGEERKILVHVPTISIVSKGPFCTELSMVNSKPGTHIQITEPYEYVLHLITGDSLE